ncbi:hypothetical protein [Mucilaginibacter ginkgonis]|uniref:Uncharacterized protein n=1 Tax=Mucilaginibacter ginkgonis TaxID=2682091 RepID=A0A6I4HYS9_9SPHI|nr:hypothetical protein [Mucilaginibacter ginkgonis]QQL51410.1 hypothetical protein GO620_008205 [Mucilaginibacter ginkgonis]
MRTSLNKIAETEIFLQGDMEPNDALLFKADMLINPSLEENVTAQARTYHLIKQYSRKQLKAELETVHQKLFTQSRFRIFAERVKRLFNDEPFK